MHRTLLLIALLLQAPLALAVTFEREGVTVEVPEPFESTRVLTDPKTGVESHYFTTEKRRTILLVRFDTLAKRPELQKILPVTLESNDYAYTALESMTQQARTPKGGAAVPAERSSLSGKPAVSFSVTHVRPGGDVTWRQTSLIWQRGIVDLVVIHPVAGEEAVVESLSRAVGSLRLAAP